MIVAKLVGSFRWSSRGVMLHLLPDGSDMQAAKALCGAKPRGTSHGWTDYDASVTEATCTRCIAKSQLQI